MSSRGGGGGGGGGGGVRAQAQAQAQAQAAGLEEQARKRKRKRPQAVQQKEKEAKAMAMAKAKGRAAAGAAAAAASPVRAGASPVRGGADVLDPAFLSPAVLRGRDDALVKRLQKLQEHLSRLGQEANSHQCDATAAALAQNVVLRHRNRDVRMLAACCLADLVRIYAPNAPYDDDQLGAVFELFIDQLGSLESAGVSDSRATAGGASSAFQRAFYLLERLAAVKAFVLLVDIDPDAELLVRLFSLFFSVAGPGPAAAPGGGVRGRGAPAGVRAGQQQVSQTVRTRMLDVMAAVLEECDTVPPALLDAILVNLVTPHKIESPVAYRLAQTLVYRCATRLQSHITAFLAGDDLESAGASDLGDHRNELIFEMNRISPAILLKVFPILEQRLTVDHVETRRDAVGLLARMFAVKGSTLARDYRALFDVFLARFADRDAEIRLKTVEFARHYIVNQTFGVADVCAALADRLCDRDERVRAQATAALCAVARDVPDTVSSAAMAALAERLRDKRPAIRKLALSGAAQLFRLLADRHGAFCARWDDALAAKFAWIPAKLLDHYVLPDADRLLVERLLAAHVLVSGGGSGGGGGGPPPRAAERYARLLGFLASANAHAYGCFWKLAREKREFQRAWARFSGARAALAPALRDTDEDLTAAMRALAATFAPAHADAALAAVRSLNRLKDAALAKVLDVLANPTTPADAADRARRDVRVRLAQRLPFARKFADKLYNPFCGPGVVAVLAEIVLGGDSSGSGGDAAELEADAAVSYLRELAALAPEDFHDLPASDLARLLERDPRAIAVVERWVGGGGGSSGGGGGGGSGNGEFSPAPRAANPGEIDTLRRELLSRCRQPAGPAEARAATRALARLCAAAAAAADADGEGSAAVRASRTPRKLLAETVGALVLPGATPARRRRDGGGTPDLPSALAIVAALAASASDAYEEHRVAVERFVTDLLAGGREMASHDGAAKRWAVKVLEGCILGLPAAPAAAAAAAAAAAGSGADGGAFDTPSVRALLDERLLEILRRGGDLSPGRDTPEHERPVILLAAARALVRVARRPDVDGLLGAADLQLLTGVLRDEDSSVRLGFLRKLRKGLEAQQLPIRWLAVVCIALADADREVAAEARLALTRAVAMRRRLARENPRVHETPALQQAILPEYTLVHVVHTLAHLPGWDADGHVLPARTLSVLFDVLLFPESAPDNVSFLRLMLEHIDRCVDRQDPDSTNHHVIVAIARVILQSKVDRRAWNEAKVPHGIFLPAKIFGLPESGTPLPPRQCLPQRFVIPPRKGGGIGGGGGGGRGGGTSSSAVARTSPASGAPRSPSKRAAAAESASKRGSSAGASASRSKPAKRKRPSSARRAAWDCSEESDDVGEDEDEDDDDDEDEDEEEDEEEKERGDDDGDDEEEDVPLIRRTGPNYEVRALEIPRRAGRSPQRGRARARAATSAAADSESEPEVTRPRRSTRRPVH